MPIVKEREYRALAAPLSVADAAKRITTDYYVEGYATTFNSPYLLFEFEDGWKYYEVIEAHAVDGADLSDVIFQYNHSGRVFARQSNKSLIVQPDNTGLFMCAAKWKLSSSSDNRFLAVLKAVSTVAGASYAPSGLIHTRSISL